MDEAMHYVLSLSGVTVAIVGCQTPAEVEDNVRIVRQFVPLGDAALQRLEECTRQEVDRFTYYKRPEH